MGHARAAAHRAGQRNVVVGSRAQEAPSVSIAGGALLRRGGDGHAQPPGGPVRARADLMELLPRCIRWQIACTRCPPALWKLSHQINRRSLWPGATITACGVSRANTSGTQSRPRPICAGNKISFETATRVFDDSNCGTSARLYSFSDAASECYTVHDKLLIDYGRQLSTRSPLSCGIASRGLGHVLRPEIDERTLNRLINGLATSTGQYSHVHLLFQSNGGFIGDGVCLTICFAA
jgi:hypothetical protein